MFMGYTNIGTLMKINEQQKESKGYIQIANLNVDFRKLKKMTRQEYHNMKDLRISSYANSFEDALSKFCIAMHENNIPFDGIEVEGDPGIIVRDTYHLKYMEEYMKENVFNSRAILHWYDINSKQYMRSLKMDDVLPNYVPINFSFRPTIILKKQGNNYNEKRCDSYDRLGIEPIEFFHQDIVEYNEFIKELNEDGYHLFFRKQEPKTYQEYFDIIRDCSSYEKLSMNVDLANDTNISMHK